MNCSAFVDGSDARQFPFGFIIQHADPRNFKTPSSVDLTIVNQVRWSD